MSLKHPVERGVSDRRRPFDRFAPRASRELRGEHAIQVKLDARATGMLEGMRQDGDAAEAMLEGAIGREEHV